MGAPSKLAVLDCDQQSLLSRDPLQRHVPETSGLGVLRADCPVEILFNSFCFAAHVVSTYFTMKSFLHQGIVFKSMCIVVLCMLNLNIPFVHGQLPDLGTISQREKVLQHCHNQLQNPPLISHLWGPCHRPLWLFAPKIIPVSIQKTHCLYTKVRCSNQSGKHLIAMAYSVRSLRAC